MPGSGHHEPLMPIACSRLKMTVSWRMNLLSLIFTLLATLALTEDAKAGSGKWVHAGSNITLRYDGEQSGRYRNLSVMKQGNLVRRIALSKRSYSLFEYDPDPATSPDGRYVLVTDVESGEVGLTDGRGSMHERQYCGFIDTRSGCLLARQTGQFCGGQFNDAGAWVSPALPDLHPSEVHPTAEDYASGRLSPRMHPMVPSTICFAATHQAQATGTTTGS